MTASGRSIVVPRAPAGELLVSRTCSKDKQHGAQHCLQRTMLDALIGGRLHAADKMVQSNFITSVGCIEKGPTQARFCFLRLAQ
jgi:hypothetical protein